MEQVKMRDCGDGYRRADVGSFSPTVVKTASYTILSADAGKTFSNRGAGGKVVFTLPAASEGKFFRFAKVAGQQIDITPTGGAKIDTGAANTALNIGSTVVTEITVVSDGTDWFTNLNSPGTTLAAMEQGTNGQLVIGQTGAASAYTTVTGDVTISAAGVTAIGAKKVTSAMLEDTALHYVTVAISAADIVATASGKLSNAAGQTLLASPGTGKVIEVISATLEFTYGGAAFTGGGNITVNYTGGAAVTGIVSAANSFAAAADKLYCLRALSDAGYPMVKETGISLVAASVPFVNGGSATGTAKVFLTYRIHTL